MSEGRQRDAWEHTSLIASILVNCRPNRPANSKIYPPRRFNPFHNRRPRILKRITDPHELYDILTEGT